MCRTGVLYVKNNCFQFQIFRFVSTNFSILNWVGQMRQRQIAAFGEKVSIACHVVVVVGSRGMTNN